MKNKGFTLIELLIVIAILGIIAAVIGINVSNFFGTAGNETANNGTATDNATIFEQLSSEPITSLNLTQLNFMVDYCIWRNTRYSESTYWSTLANVYQNQILILQEGDKP